MPSLFFAFLHFSRRLKRFLFTVSPSLGMKSPRIRNFGRSPRSSDNPFIKTLACKPRSGLLKYRIVFYGAVVLSFFTSPAAYLSFKNLALERSTEHQFLVSSGYHPVLDEADPNRFLNNPVSKFRPQNQFSSSFAPGDGTSASGVRPSGQESILSVLTVTRNPRSHFAETAKFIQQQSLAPISWIIVNDHSDSEESIRLLQRVAQSDSRITLVDSTNARGYTHGRIFALNYLRVHSTRYYAFLDDDDMHELTAYEKCVWMLETNDNFSMCGSYVVGFGDKNFISNRGYHNDGSMHFHENLLTGSEVVRTHVLNDTDCKLNAELDGEMADWELHLCLAAKGKWGATIPEPLFWQRQNPDEMRRDRWSALLANQEKSENYIQTKYKSLNESFPDVSPQFSKAFEGIHIELPFENKIHPERSVLFIVPSIGKSRLDLLHLGLVQELSKLGYRVTVVCTLLDINGLSMHSRPHFMQYTHDVFFLPGMLRAVEAPRFLSYIIESRNIELVMISSSEMGYGMLPWLAAKYTQIRFMDFAQEEQLKHEDDRFISYSVIHEDSLDATFIPSLQVKKMLLERGHSGSSLEVGHPGISLKTLNPLSEAKRKALRSEMGIKADATVVIYVGHNIEDEQLRFASRAFQSFREMEKKLFDTSGTEASAFSLLVVDSNPNGGSIMAPTGDSSQFVRVRDNQSLIRNLSVSDIFFVPSEAGSIPFALEAAMALGVTPLVADSGDYSKLLGRTGSNGILVPLSGDEEKDINGFVEGMKNLVSNKEMLKELSRNAAYRVRNLFDSSRTIPALVDRILDYPLTRTGVDLSGDDYSSLYYAQERILSEVREFSDFLEIQRKIRGKARSGFGQTYRVKCGEFSEEMSALIDMLEDPQSCTEGFEINVQALQNNAIMQCRQWCITNLDDSGRITGWQGDERCGGFHRFNESDHNCAQMYHDRRRRQSRREG